MWCSMPVSSLIGGRWGQRIANDLIPLQNVTRELAKFKNVLLSITRQAGVMVRAKRRVVINTVIGSAVNASIEGVPKTYLGVRPVNWRVISLGLVQADQRVSCSQERLQTHSAERSR